MPGQTRSCVVHNSECQKSGRTLIVILGACATGKTTLTRALWGEGGIEHTAEFDCKFL
jgi:ABC-type cobalamin/Fe3+-siderophores transport system ATPase subunit